jgi:hypothetical protein
MVHITVLTAFSLRFPIGGVSGQLRIVLRGQPSAGGGLAVDSFDVALAPTSNGASYQGQVESIQGSTLVVTRTDAAGGRIRLAVQIQIDPAGTVTGMVSGKPA